MRAWIVLLSLMAVSPAPAQFLGGFAEGMADAERRELQRRALELDARDGGSRYDRLRQQQELEAIVRELRRQTDLLEQQRRDRLIGGRP